MRAGGRTSLFGLGMRKLRIRNGGKVVQVERSIINYSNAVYLLVSPRLHSYAKGRSRILYIGRTRKGAERVLSSVSDRLWEAFPRLHGVDRLGVYIVGWRGRRALNSSRYAEMVRTPVESYTHPGRG